MVGQRAVVVRVAGSRPRGALEGPAARAGRPATGGVSPPPVARVPAARVKARGLAAVVPREPPRDLRRGLRRPTGRAGRAALLPPRDLAGPATLAARHPVTSRAMARPLAMVKGHAGRRARRAQARRERARLTAGHARAGTLREPLPMVMSEAAARGPRPVVSSVARAGPRPRVSSAAARGPRRATDPGRPTGTQRAAPRPARRGHRRVALPVTGPGPRGRTDPDRGAAETANVTVAGRQIATSGVMTAVRPRAMVPAVRTATTAPQRATGRVVPAAGMAPHMSAASVQTTAAWHVTGVPPVTGVRDRIRPRIGPRVTGVRDRIRPRIGRPVGAVRMARRRGLPAVGPGTARRAATLVLTAPRRRPEDVTETAGRNVRPRGGSGPDRGTEAVPEAR
jgi:hypothetical protein